MLLIAGEAKKNFTLEKMVPKNISTAIVAPLLHDSVKKIIFLR